MRMCTPDNRGADAFCQAKPYRKLPGAGGGAKFSPQFGFQRDHFLDILQKPAPRFSYLNPVRVSDKKLNANIIFKNTQLAA